MTFLNPAILFGLLAISLPVAIHLLSKPRLKRIHWAATKLLIQSVQLNRSRMQLEDLLLLILRCLVVILLVLTFARPALMVASTGLGFSGNQTTAVILLDASASMGQSNGVQSRFDEAKSKIDNFLSHLGAHSKCAFYLVSDVAKPIIAQPTDDLDAVRHALEQAEDSDRGTDLFPGIKAAFDLLKANPGEHREIDVFTDSQLGAWRDLGRIRQLVQDNHAEVEFHVIVIGDQGEDNLAVSGVKMVGTVAAINEPVICSVQVSNWGHTPASKILVKLAVDNAAPQDQKTIDQIPAGASATINLTARFREPGYHSVTATIPGDRLPADNECSTALLVIDQLKALMVTDSTTGESAKDGFFLTHALQPVPSQEINNYYLKVTNVTPPSLDHATLAEDSVIFLTGVSKLDLLGAKNLRNYVNEGGALIIFPGLSANPDFYNNDSDLQTLLPAKLGQPIDAPSSQKFITWSSHDYQHPIVTLWNDPSSGNLGTIHVFKYFPLTVTASSGDASITDPEIVVKYANGEPAVVESKIGKGKVVLFSTPATTAWSTLPLDPAFVPLVLRTVAYAMSTQLGDLVITAGQTFSYPVGSDLAGKDFFVQRPGHKDEHRLAGKIEAGDQSAFLRYSATEKAGVYRLYTGDDVQPKVVFAAQIDPTESNLQQESKEDVASLTKSNDAASSDTNKDSSSSATPARLVPGWEMGFVLALVALCLSLLELGVAHWSSQSK